MFRPYSGAGGLKEEYEQIAADNPDIVKLVTIGQSVNGQDIIALKVTRRANQTRDGRRPATLYSSAQHAREWITPEMNRRLVHHVIDNYGSDPTITDVVDRTELWFVPVANPDGYDFTFEPGQRLWRKNLRDNDGDGTITDADGVDPNRNYPTKWGVRQRGLVRRLHQRDLPRDRPRVRARDAGPRRPDGAHRLRVPDQLPLGRRAAAVRHRLAGRHADARRRRLRGDGRRRRQPRRPDLRPRHLGRAVHDQRRDHRARPLAYGTLAFTPEMATCETAAESVPDDEWLPEDCGSGFKFPDDEELVQAEFEKNIPFAIATAQSALDPDDPVSVVGRTAPDFVVDSFEVSYGDPQTVAVTARRSQVLRWMTYRINGGRPRFTFAPEWRGGDRYGAEGEVYYGEFRGEVRGARPGDTVQVQFSGLDLRRGLVQSEPFTYTVAGDSGADVLVIADEDVTGVNPTYPAGTTGPKYLDDYVAALDANGISHDTWDVDSPGRPPSARRARPLRRGHLGARRQPPHPGPRGRAHRHVPVRCRSPTWRWPRRSST